MEEDSIGKQGSMESLRRVPSGTKAGKQLDEMWVLYSGDIKEWSAECLGCACISSVTVVLSKR